MKPSPLTNAIFLYCLAVAAEKHDKYGVLVHAFVVLGNHYHAVVSDQHGNIPQFMAYLNRLTATCVNASIGRWENLWANEQPSLVKLDGLEDALRALVYTFTNPLSSYLVKRSDRWPGLRMVPTDLLKGHTDLLKGHIDLLKGHIDLLKGHIEAVRPSVFFREDGPMLERVSLKISRPECFANMTDEQLVATLQQRIHDKEDKEYKGRRAPARGRGQGHPVPWHQAPRTPAPRASAPHRHAHQPRAPPKPQPARGLQEQVAPH